MWPWNKRRKTDLIRGEQKEELKYWRKIFFVEIGAGLQYPSQEERWAKYGEPLSRIFSLFFEPPITYTWFKDKKSQSILEGVNVTCLESRFKWAESQNDLVDLGLLFILSDKVNELFTRLGAAGALVTGVFSHPDPTDKVFVTLTQTSIPVTLDSLDISYPAYFVLQSEPRINFCFYMGGTTFCRRLCILPDEEVLKLIEKVKDVHILGGATSLNFGERENPIVTVIPPKEISYEQAKKILGKR